MAQHDKNMIVAVLKFMLFFFYALLFLNSCYG